MTDSSERNLVIEYFKSAREELLFRVQHRDAWLKLELITQAILWGLANGVKINGVEYTRKMPEILVIALPIAFVMAALYYVEDDIISMLNKYCIELSSTADPSMKITNWDSSKEYKKYTKGFGLNVRLLAQFAAFLILPLLLLTNFLSADKSIDRLQGAFAFTVFILILFGWFQRRA